MGWRRPYTSRAHIGTQRNRRPRDPGFTDNLLYLLLEDPRRGRRTPAASAATRS